MFGSTGKMVLLSGTRILRPCGAMARVCPSPLAPLAAAFSVSCRRDFQSKRLSRNIEFFTASEKPLPDPKETIQMAKALSNGERPMTLLFCWLMSKERHIRKYAQFYTDMGIDVLKVRISPIDLLRPTRGSHMVADQVLDFLHANPSHAPLLVHGFSVGGYVFTEVMVKVERDFKTHGHLLNRFVGQIWDSGVDMDGIPVGMPRALTNNKVLQASLKKYLEWFMAANYDAATIHYERASAKMHQCFVNVPGLFLLSKTDPVSTPEMNAKVYRKWEAKGIPVFVKCWDRSPHVSHYHRHRHEYEAQVMAFLERVGMIEPATAKIRAVSS
ncbi:uncharacterized protein LOC143032774 [Oratosquilla oratoria]|uniref:uncharacterized protein LOC143032774 n=1 Tax=Oratosquilla oratoria TaxID=337810 RepID=UPI003F75A9D3